MRAIGIAIAPFGRGQKASGQVNEATPGRNGVATRRVTHLGLLTASALTVPALLGTTPAFAGPSSVGETIRGVQVGNGTGFGGLTTCTESFSGEVTQDRGTSMGFTVGLERFSYSQCTSGARVTLNEMPSRLDIDAIGLWVIMPMDVNVTTSRGTCRYTGNLGDTTGFFSSGQLRGNGFFFRKSSGCGGPRSIQVTQTQALLAEDGDPPPL